MSQDGPALLVVDDNEDNLYTLTERLRREGYTNVGTARDGRQALELLRARPFDLVLLDVMMPEVNGYQVLEELKADDGLRSIPVIMISAVDELESVIRCVELGAADYLPKPFNPVLLRARIGACLEKKRLHDRLLEWSHTLEERVREKVAEVERLGRLKRFFSPHLAELIVAGGAEDPLKTIPEAGRGVQRRRTQSGRLTGAPLTPGAPREPERGVRRDPVAPRPTRS